ncbi:serine/threonine protein kinase [Ignisphaera aggregans DSM 17230]|uniref:Serine/threonine protein kinase n=1 Tax=Ignisphaera aggregans (strain DSM 17230 / JCM 13409 / AQ1.S1) TaxID=583356 RepID=E0STL9_IGNAA|nr:serine/threonine protein kinase [Ignisphaera aggregans DSM 17230]
MESVLGEIERVVEELKRVMVGGYGFVFAKKLLREARELCMRGDFLGCLEFVRRAVNGVEREKKVVSVLNELRKVIGDNVELKRFYDNIVNMLRAGDLDSAENMLKEFVDRVREWRKRRFMEILEAFEREVGEFERIFAGYGITSSNLVSARNLVNELKEYLARGLIEEAESIFSELRRILDVVRGEVGEAEKRFRERRFSISIADIEQLLANSVSGLLTGYSCVEGYKPRRVSLRRDIAPEGFEGEWECCLLGCGGWGCAYRCIGSNGESIVFKVPRGFESLIDYGSIPTVSRKLMERITEEANTIKALKHPNILRLYGVSSTAPLLIYEYADYGSLEWQIARGWKPSLREALLIAIQIGDAIRYIHSRGLVHGDIKAGNIFFVKGVAKLGDFSSLVKLLAKTSSHSRYTYTPGWCAPEQIYSDLMRKASERGLESRMDVYQLGNLLLYLLSGDTIDGEEAIKPGKIESYIKSIEQDALREILMEMLNPEPWNRISSEESVKRLLEVYSSL